MTLVTAVKSARRPHHRRRRVPVGPAALCTVAAVAGAAVHLTGAEPGGPFPPLLAAVAVIAVAVIAMAVIAMAAFPAWWARHHRHAPPADTAHPADGAGGTEEDRTEGTEGTALWRMRTTVRDAPGSLAALCTALASLGVDILTLQTHPLAEGTVDEFLLRTPASIPARRLTDAVAAAGGRDTWTERADPHDLVDTPTRVLALATRTALDSAELPLALRRLLGRCTVHSRPAVSPAGRPAGDLPPVEGVLEETVMRLRDPSGGELTVERPHLPFTPAEFARARALLELDARLGARVPRHRDVLTLPEGGEITVRRADQRDVAAAKAMQERCSDRTLRQRYHGSSGDAHRYLDHLLSPRFGRSLAAQTESGRLVALGHLLWDGDETELALIVEDSWQRRGIGSELLGRLIGLAREAGCGQVYAVTQSSNTGMVAAMRGLGLPLDYQVEGGVLVVTAQLAGAGAEPGPRLEEAER
ncbi:GNAT family N-acetyltransferase [Streptomyces jumonjinensis]|uniref:GNAT family N-acetyltransferase n=1 Tax=Streptomyces jumonjinensis TaxID=1945 RepID=A0A646KNL9_STRJU|nr:GNAT family N-acetyltransferase [Streptomyces jumonjinensis]MQT03658.1 GNAT family N-acetyltransferase [Streptomyces jumonjinensis]